MEITPAYTTHAPARYASAGHFHIPLVGIERAVKQIKNASDDLARGNAHPRPYIKIIQGLYAIKGNAIVLSTMHATTGTLLNAYA